MKVKTEDEFGHTSNKLSTLRSMKINTVEIILYVSNQELSRNFYEALLHQAPSLHVPGMTEFTISENLKLGLMPNAGIAKILGDRTPHPETGTGIPRCELYLHVEELQKEFKNAIRAGAKVVSEIAERNWGDRVGYLADLDGHVVALAGKF